MNYRNFLIGLAVFIVLGLVAFLVWWFGFRDEQKTEAKTETETEVEPEAEAEAQAEEDEAEEAGPEANEPVGITYTLLENTDYPGNDIRQEKGKTLEQLKVICGQEDACKGFNTSGFLKSKLGNKIAQKGVMFYQKDIPIPEGVQASASASATSGVAGTSATYTKMDNTDFPGNDIRNVSGKSIAELKNICSQEEACKGFNSSGWLKSKTTSPITQQGVTFYKKNLAGSTSASASSGASASVSLSPVSKFKVRSNTGIPMRMGNLYCEINQTLDSCAQKCLDDARCKAITMERKDNGLCCLKSSVDGAIPNDNYDLYEKL